ncbi:hypothetical protein GGF46_000908 [Coemansia sp. RSA 552]|nr:hypothetical protein GGF46_000908 [Coemansia sp. RSA 552]
MADTLPLSEAPAWLAPLESFFRKTGLWQSLHALQIETVVLPHAPKDDIKDCLRCLSEEIHEYLAQPDSATRPSSGGDRDKLVRSTVQSTLSTEQMARTVDDFIDKQRKAIDSSNRDEFLAPGSTGDSTCARIDVKGDSCGVKLQQSGIQHDKAALGCSAATKQGSEDGTEQPPEAAPLDGLEERVDNIREHLNVRFVPEATNIYRRVSALEDRIMILEREFPPWAAENFNQPGRRYTQPPPVTVYRAMPAAPRYAAAPSPSPARPAGKQLYRPALPAAPRSASAMAQGYHRQPTPKRKKTGVYVNSPLDAKGNPLFYSCGRGVNSSLTRSVLAQLQTRQGSALSPPEKQPDPAADLSKSNGEDAI